MRTNLRVVPLALLALGAMLPAQARAVVFTVTNTNDSGNGSLRKAITDANALVTPDTIEFAIPGLTTHTINLLSPLPTFTTDPLIIDGTSQLGYGAGGPPKIVLNCSAIAVLGAAIQVSTQGCEIRAITIHGYDTPVSSAAIRVTVPACTIEDCYIGTTADGTGDAGNSTGIHIDAGNSVITIRRCVISGNALGVRLDGDVTMLDCKVGTNAAGTGAISNSVGLRCEAGFTGVIGDCLISGNGTGVLSLGRTPDILNGKVGTNDAGTAAIPNTVVGINIRNGAANQAGLTRIMNNVISGNTGVPGVLLDTGLQAGTFPGVQVTHNRIGTNDAGTAAVPNGTGIQVLSGSAHVIGAVGAGNLVSGNTGRGIQVNSTASGVIIKGNFVGTNAAGDAPVPNSGGGIGAFGPDMRIGDSLNAGAGNLISGNGGVGLDLTVGPSLGPAFVQQNKIGVNAAATLGLSNASDGMRIGGTDHFIGGGAAFARNIIGGNFGHGIVFNAPATGVRVLGNSIGTDATGTVNLGNSGHGALISSSSVTGCSVGEYVAGGTNLIAFNGSDGVSLTAGTGNVVRFNYIYSNGGLGIDLGTTGITPNDAVDADSGPNGTQNFPILTSATFPNSGTHIRGTLSSAANTTYAIEFFLSVACDPTGNGEGQRFVGPTTVTTDASGQASFDIVTNSPVLGTIVTATATDPTGNTSEFSPCLPIRPGVWFVNDNATGANTGASWANAFTDLQSALATAAPGEEIWVAGGFYLPTIPAGRGATFTLESGVGVYGGFAGTESARSQRNPTANVTVLSGNIGNFASTADNSFHVVTAPNGVDETAVLDGFAVTGGNASPDTVGGGLWMNGSNPTVRNCFFRFNSSATFGGGIYVSNSPAPAEITNCIFLGNSGAPGGAIAAVSGSGPVLLNCLLISNTSSSSGAALRVSAPVSPTILINCTLANNTSATGAAVTFGNAGSSLQASNCVIWGNTPAQIVTTGGAGATVLYCDVQGGFAGTGNINADPRFVDPDGLDGHPASSDDNYRLGPGSPCIDAGKGLLLPAGTTTDLAGGPRSIDAVLIADTGGAPFPVVDMGAYEAAADTPNCGGDFDGSGTVNPADVAVFINTWSASLAAGTLAGDFDHNGTVNPADVAAFINAWSTAVASGC